MIVLLFGVLFSQAAFNLTFLQPDSTQETFVFAGLSALIFLIFVALTFVLMRNLLKLYAETRGGVLGSRFRTKMVVGALLLSITPTIFLFLFSYALMNRSINRWFSRPVEELQQDSESIANLLQSYVADNAFAEAKSIADSPESHRAYDTKNFGPLTAELRKHEPTLQGGFAVAMLDGETVTAFHIPEPWAELKQRIRTHRRFGAVAQTIELPDGRRFLYSEAPSGPHGSIIVGVPLPAKFFDTVAKVQASEQRYYELGQARKQVRRFYMLLLSVITAAVLFAATWLSMFVSRFVTRPVSALAKAAQELSSGNLDYRIEYETKDELGDLIQRFNRMADEIGANRQQLLASRAEIEQRRRQIETIIESIPSGVMSVDELGRITLLNGAFARMFPGVTAPIGGIWTRAFSPETTDELQRLMRRADRMGMAGAQLEIEHGANGRIDVALTVASLGDHTRSKFGHVLDFEDFSDLLKAQKKAAWQEVARRVAHEIKNPLTPISLSAERIQRYLDRGAIDGNASEVIRSCAVSIATNVETVRRLVNEFSSMAQFPSAHPVPADINSIIRSALAMFDGRIAGIDLRTELAPDLPRVLADTEAMRRAIANLVDNAADAMSDSLVKQISISTALVDSRDAVEVTVADTGSGITSDIKEKLFLPYFSTKNRGTGLGLAIVSRIVEEHHGTVRVEENKPVGARFVLEIPVATESMEANA
ncbi:MAG TPA: ATP-binding protein [Terriglobales bacterium]